MLDVKMSAVKQTYIRGQALAHLNGKQKISAVRKVYFCALSCTMTVSLRQKASLIHHEQNELRK